MERLTKVVFRKWKSNGGIIALFPEIPGNGHLGTCLSFEHVGQHATASPLLTQAYTTPATESEYESLKRELESDPHGYRLKVLKRMPPTMRVQTY